MPQRNKSNSAVRHHLHDFLTACLDADATYVCTAYNSRCYIIQKITPTQTSNNLNPEARSFESEKKSSEKDSYEIVESEFPPLDRSVYMNGDVGKVPPGAVYTATPDQHTPSPITDFSALNGVTDPLENFSEGGASPAAAAGQAPPDPLPEPTHQTPPMPIEQLKQMLSSQLEYYFSRENLANDTYLLSQMDNDQYVPIWTVANFNQVKKLTTDIKLITEVLRESPNLQVDDEGQKVRPNHKRCIVILREIPDNTPLEEVKGLFSGRGCPKLISCEFAHNNSWYVTFENDDDAQKAYCFLREEVKEFQGRPIMARIKAKPMNRLIVPSVGPGMGGMKNGYRTPPAATVAATNVYEPNAYAAAGGQQRYLFTNGTSIAATPNVNYPASQVQIYFQPQQPFYPPNMLPSWTPAASTTYFDIGSVFSVNGLAPQGPFAKSHPNRYASRNRHKRVVGGLEQRTTMSDSGLVRGPHASGSKMGTAKLETSSSSVSSKSHYFRDSNQSEVADPLTAPRHDPEDPFRSPTAAKESIPARRRRKEDDAQRGSGSPGPQFDLEADAFPPLPGLEQSQSQNVAKAPSSPPAQTPPVSAVVTSAAADPPPVEQPSPQWTENRLSDVVKGTAKGKNASGSSNNGSKEKETPCSGGIGAQGGPLSPRLPSPQLPTPPPTPDKTVPGAAGSNKVAQADKTKTDDAVINGNIEPVTVGSNGSNDSLIESKTHSSYTTATAAPVPELPNPPHQPPLTPSQPAQNQADLVVAKLSYAQVAQHHKEKAEREKQLQLQQQQQQQTSTVATAVITVSQTAPPQSDEDKKESTGYYQGKGETNVGRGRGGGPRAPPRRRENSQRFNSRQRSPK